MVKKLQEVGQKAASTSCIYKAAESVPVVLATSHTCTHTNTLIAQPHIQYTLKGGLAVAGTVHTHTQSTATHTD